MTLTKTSTLTQFKETDFYKATKEYMATTPLDGKLLKPETIEEVLEGAYWRMYNGENLEGIK
tara:strand:+ start:99 stop:284 length:186 start_codon:yes stop_codon:yes gene_type:complete